MISAANMHYEIADKTRATAAGGIGLIHRLVKAVELDKAINRHVNLFKIYLPYCESDHVLNIAYNIFAGGSCLEHLELRRHDEAYLDSLGAQRLPDPTTAGDFCRRFNLVSIWMLMEVFNSVRLKVWRQQPDSFFEEAVIDADGSMVETNGECKQGMDINYKKQWREFKDIKLRREYVAEFSYRPTKCQKTYRVVVVWKDLEVHQGQQTLFNDSKCFFYITNDRLSSAPAIVRHAHQRCNQENLIEQQKNGVHALKAPLDNLTSNWAYMVIASLAWNLKAWAALLVPTRPRWRQRHEAAKQTLLRMDFSTFRQAMINIPAQIVHSSRRLVYRLLAWNRWQSTFFRLWDQLQQPLRC